MKDKATRQRGKYGWARKMIEKFLAGSSAENCWVVFDCPDDFGRDQKQLYKVLYNAISRNFYDDPVEVKLLDDWPDQVWLHRTDIDED